MKKIITLAATSLILITVAGCGSKPNTPVNGQQNGANDVGGGQQAQTAHSFSGSIKDLIGLNKNFRCDVQATANDVGGTAYVNGNKSRVDVQVAKNSGDQPGHFIYDGTTMYAWDDSGKQAVKMNVGDLEKMNQANGTNVQTDAAADVTANDPYDATGSYNCYDWAPDPALFVPPANITFVDFNAEVEGMMQQNLQNLDPATKKTLCAQCDTAASSADKAACKKELACP